MRRKILLLLFAACLTTGCKDIFETDISEKAVSVQGPQHGTWVAPGEVSFIWYELDGADEYRLIVVTPNFDTPARIVADTVVQALYFSTVLTEGDYGWSIQPRNFGYNGLLQSYVLHVGTPPEEDPSGKDGEEEEPAQENDEGEANETGNEPENE